jgi:hypothetical protein
MVRQINESDWQYTKRKKEELLNRFCGRILASVKRIADTEGISEYERYIELYKLIQQKDKIVADCFDNWRRSNILEKIMRLYSEGIITEEELNELSEETRIVVRRVLTN